MISPSTDYESFFGKDDEKKPDESSTAADIHTMTTLDMNNSNNSSTNNNNNNNNTNSADDVTDTTNMNMSLNMSDPQVDVTPSILLEQLAYVDNFFPSLDHDFASVDSWMLGASPSNVSTSNNNNSNNANFNNNNDPNTSTSLFEPPVGLDEQLSVELSVFADDAFIFPDEDKSRNNNNDNDNDDNRENKDNDGDEDLGGLDLDNNSTRQRNPHFLTQRRSNFLMSQYDHSRARFSSNRRRLANSDSNNNGTDNGINDGSSNGSPRRVSDDHGEFTNVNIGTPTNTTPPSMDTFNSPTTGGPLDSNTGNGEDTTLSPPASQIGAQNDLNEVPKDPVQAVKRHRPSVSSPLNNVIANSSQWNSQYPINGSTSNNTTTNNITNNNNNNNNNNNPSSHNDIELPNYSSIPTSTLVSLLPRVKVPSGAYNTLVSLGFSSDQIDAMSALIAYNEQQKNRNGELINHNNISNEDSLKTLLDLFNTAPSRHHSQQQQVLIPNHHIPPQQHHPQVQQQTLPQQNLGSQPSPIQTAVSPIENGNNQIQPNGISNSDSEFLESILKMQAPSRTRDTVQTKEEVKSADGNLEPIVRTKSETQVKDSNQKRSQKSNNLTRSHSVDTNMDEEPSRKRERSVSFDDDEEDDEDDPYSSSKRNSIDSTGRSQKAAEGSKRKIKEKELETSIQELSELAVSLQQKIHTLEMENKLLKNLVLSSGDLNMVGLDATASKSVGKKAPASEIKR
ncbi:Met4p [Nakaseomyces bracarensis]|uniref:Met4p n=1 Tax=Nakaseomyces bracarensis TaxID=273131 RepID=UPI0038715D40